MERGFLLSRKLFQLAIVFFEFWCLDPLGLLLCHKQWCVLVSWPMVPDVDSQADWMNMIMDKLGILRDNKEWFEALQSIQRQQGESCYFSLRFECLQVQNWKKWEIATIKSPVVANFVISLPLSAKNHVTNTWIAEMLQVEFLGQIVVQLSHMSACLLQSLFS